MDCKELRAYYDSLLRGVPTRRNPEIETHVVECQSCDGWRLSWEIHVYEFMATVPDQLREIRGALRDLDPPPAMRAYLQQHLERIEARYHEFQKFTGGDAE